VTAAAVLAFSGAVCGVLGAWEALAAIERTRVVAFVVRALAPVVRAGREGVGPTAPERRRLAVLVAGSLAAAGWLVGGLALAVGAAVVGPAAATALVRARRRRFRAALADAAAPVARALADALSAGLSVRGAIGVTAGTVPGAPGHELDAAARALALGASTEAVLERLRRRAGAAAWDAMVAGILLQRDAGGDLPALLRDLASGLEAAARQDREALAATAQARFTARLVLAMPLLAAVLAELASPGFIGRLLGNPMSGALATLAATFQLVAVIAVRRLSRAVQR
jgi:tight adherence protein B